jgi:hypothetical protein
MALDATNLKKVAGAGDMNVFIYKSTDAIGTIVGSGYFNNSTADLKQFDIILCVGATGGTATVDVAVITSATAATTVTATNGT